MWASFSVSCLFAVVLLYLPGCLFFGGLLIKRKLLIAWAPFVSLAILVVSGQLFHAADLHVSGLILFSMVVLFAFALGLLRFFLFRTKALSAGSRNTDSSYAGDRGGVAFLYVCLGAFVSVYAFVLVMGSPDWFSTEIDNAYHLNELYAMASTSQFSAISISVFPTVQGFGAADSASFYPALWHVVAAVTLSATGVSAPVAENAVNLAFVAVVFPLGVWSFLTTVFEDSKRIVVVGSLTCVCFFDFPWRLLTYGLLCSNLAAFAMVPAALSLFVVFAKARTGKIGRLSLFALLVIACSCLVLLQPNAVFSCIVLLAFFGAWQFLYGETAFGFRVRERLRVWLAALFVLLCVIVWIAAYNASFMQGVLSVSWDHFSSKTQGLFNILLLSYCGGPASPIMAFLVLVGIVSVLRNKSLRWLTYTYLLCASIHFSTASTESILKHWLSGFWYTDQHRTAALCVLAAIPLSAVGFVSVIDFCERLFRLLKKEGVVKIASESAAKTVSALIAVLLLAPNFVIYGIGDVDTTFGKTRALVKSDYDMNDEGSVSAKEIAFVKEAKEITGDDLVVNSPFDGTAFLYGVTGVQFYYRSLLSSPDADPNEPYESRVMRHSLCAYSSDDEVRDAVKRTNAKYVLLLDSSMDELRKHAFTYRPEDWEGIDAIGDSVEGFEVVLEEGNMKLCKISDLDQ